MTPHDALTEAVQTMLDSVGTPGKSDCPHCGDGRTAINWLSDIERVRAAFEGVRVEAVKPTERNFYCDKCGHKGEKSYDGYCPRPDCKCHCVAGKES